MFLYKFLRALAVPFVLLFPPAFIIFLFATFQIRGGSLWFLLGLTFVASGALAYYLNQHLASIISEKEWKIEWANRLCEHGVAGGRTLDRCSKCKEEMLQREAEQKRIQEAEEQRRVEVERRTKLSLRAQNFNNARLGLYSLFEKAQRHSIIYLQGLTPNEFEDKQECRQTVKPCAEGMILSG